jgi:hypothetical protein
MLSKSRRGEKLRNPPAKCHWHFSPLKREKEILLLLSNEQELPTPEVIARIPMLKRWLERGKDKTGSKEDSLASS